MTESSTDCALDYSKLLEDSFKIESEHGECGPGTRLQYLAEYVFEFTTYESAAGELFARKAVEVCAAITDNETFEYIADNDGRIWYLLMCNMPFFANRLEWGSSIRGAWWGVLPGEYFELQSCGFWLGDDQLACKIEFNKGQWESFIRAVIDFAAPEMGSDCVLGFKSNLLGEKR